MDYRPGISAVRSLPVT